MADFVSDFLEEAALRLSDSESSWAILENNPEEPNSWERVYSFFNFVRSVSSFAGFPRCYALSNTAVSELKKTERVSEIVPLLHQKYQRIKDILAASKELKQESEGSDTDLVPVEPTQEMIMASLAELSKREEVLDKREEELVSWKQALAEQEDSLKDKENALLQEKQNQTAFEEKFNSVLHKLNEQEKIQSDLEEHLAETKLALQNCQEKIASQEELQKKSENVLIAKNKSLDDMAQKIKDLNHLLNEKKVLSEQREEELYQELQENREQNQKLRNSLDLLTESHSAMNQNQDKIFAKYAKLEKEHQNTLVLLNEEKRSCEHFFREKRELEKQHIEFNTRMIDLQEQLAKEKEIVKRIEKQLKQKKSQEDVLQSELRASGWPYDPENFQRELAALAVSTEAKPPVGSLLVFKELLSQLRTQSFAKLPQFLKSMIQTCAGRYQRPYEISIKCDADISADKDALSALKQILALLTDNAFHYAFPAGKVPLRLTVNVDESDLFLHCSFADNGGFFDFDRLYNTIQTAGLTEENVTLTRSELLAYLFHNAVIFKNETRGLIEGARFLEKSGGRIKADFYDGFHVEFSLPKRFLFDKVLLFRMFDRVTALPLSSVAETIFLKEAEIRTEPETGRSFFYWKGFSIPVLRLDDSDEYKFGLIIQAGAFYFLMPVQQIADTEQLLSVSEEKIDGKFPFVSSCTVLESEREIMWLNIPELLKISPLPLPRKVVSIDEQNEAGFVKEEASSYLIFKSDPDTFGAIPVNSVLRVEDFSPSVNEAVRKQYLETQGVQLPLKDSCPKDDYLYAQAVLILENFALAVHEVADIIDVPHVKAQTEPADFIVYHGRKVPVFPVP